MISLSEIPTMDFDDFDEYFGVEHCGSCHGDFDEGYDFYEPSIVELKDGTLVATPCSCCGVARATEHCHWDWF